MLNLASSDIEDWKSPVFSQALDSLGVGVWQVRECAQSLDTM